MAEQELIFGFKFLSRSNDNRFTYGTPDKPANTISVFKNSPVSSYDGKLIFSNIKNFTALDGSLYAIYSPSVNRSDLAIGGTSTKGQIVNLSGWTPNIYDENNKAYYMLDYVSYIDDTGKETTSHTNSIVAHYKLFIPLYYKANDTASVTLVPAIEARNMSTSIGTYSITGVANREPASTSNEDIDKAYSTPIFSQNMFRFVDGDSIYYSNYSFTAAADCSSYDEIVQWLRSTSIKTVKSNNKITVNISIPSVYRKIYASKSSDPISAEQPAARYKLFLIRNTPGKKTTKIDQNNIIPHSYLVTGTRWSHPKPKNKEKYVFTYSFSAEDHYDFTYTFDLTNILQQEFRIKDGEFYLKHCADTGSWRTSKELDHSQWIFSVVMVLETNYWYDESNKQKTYTLLNKNDTGYAAAATDVPWAKRCTKIDYTSRCLFDVVK